MRPINEVIHTVIKTSGGLSDFDDPYIAEEVEDILDALSKEGYEILPIPDKRK